MSVEVWDQASGQNNVLQVENQFFDLALSQQEKHFLLQIICNSVKKLNYFLL